MELGPRICKTVGGWFGSSDGVAVIRLKGKPYASEIDGKISNSTDTLEALAINSNYERRLTGAIQQNAVNLEPLYKGGYYGIDQKLKKGRALTYEESFSLMTFVSMGTNKLVYEQLHDRLPEGMPNDPETIFYQSIALLSVMSGKEGFSGLVPEEVAGLTAAALEIDTVVRVSAPGPVVGIGGMGGDRGYPNNGKTSKLFSLSTLGSTVLANFSYVHKHHSYPNTSKVAGQSAIEAFGARSDQDTLAQLERMQGFIGLLMTSCHSIRTIHTLSHKLKGETINHVVGPMSIPIDRDVSTTAFIGVNDNIHPETITEALAILHKKGVQNYANGVAFCGLNITDIQNIRFTKSMIAIDEVAPPPYQTLAAFLVDGSNQGTFLISPEDFMESTFLKDINYQNLLVPNTFDEIMLANKMAIKGEDVSKASYLAMTVALALFTKEYSSLKGSLNKKTGKVNREMLRDAYSRSLDTILSGSGYKKLISYISASKL